MSIIIIVFYHIEKDIRLGLRTTFMIMYIFSIQTLTTLQLIKNQIGNNGAEHLADALRTNKVSYVSI